MEHAALDADIACGTGTRLVYYMSIGELLSRTLTMKDTHSPKGDLVIAFTDQVDGHDECGRRAKGNSILLGLSTPCFTYASDLILPADTNGQLREALGQSQAMTEVKVPDSNRGNNADDWFTVRLDMIARIHRQDASVYIPEVCCGDHTSIGRCSLLRQHV